MPDVEVKLNIEAEYKQALAAIAAMGKALEAVQSKADAVKNALGGATSAGNGKTDAGGAESIAALNKANRELAQALLLVNQTAEKAKAAIQSFSDLTGTSPDMIESLNQAAAGYERLATLAQTAADAAERFNNAAQPGLSTAELMKQTEAAEKQVKVLQEQAAALQETIAAQQRQLEQLKATEEQVKRNLQVREQEKKEQQLNIAQLDREAQAQEDANYRMELAGQTRLQLAHTIQELNAKLKEAAAAKDAEAWEQYSRKLKLANAQMRQLTMQARVSKIALMQQAQVAQQMGQNIKTLVSGFANLGDAAKNGELNLGAMTSSFMSLMAAFKAGMGPIGWVLLAFQLLEAAYNSHVKKEKQALENTKKNDEFREKLSERIRDNAAALKEYNANQTTDANVKALVQEHRNLNNEIREQIRLTEQAANAELFRLSLTQSEQEHAFALKKAALSRQLMTGDITQEEYEDQLAALNFEQQNAKLDAGVESARIKKQAAADKESAALSGLVAISEKTNTLRKQKEAFGWDAERLSVFEKMDADAIQAVEDARKNYEELKKNGASSNELLHARFAYNRALEESGRIRREAEEVLKDFFGEEGYAEFGFFKDALRAYKMQLKDIDSLFSEAAKAEDDALQQLQQTREELYAAEGELGRVETQTARRKRQLGESYESDTQTRRTTRETKAEKEKHKRILSQAKEELSQMSTQDMAKLSKHYTSAAAKETNVHARALYEGLAGIYSEGLESRKEGKAEQLQIGKGKYLEDGKFTLKEAQEVIKLLKKAIAQKDAEAIEVYTALLNMGKKLAADKKTVAAIKKQNKTLSR